ncbi:MAG: hypothetical protein A2068_00215 [Ignavibacteria bacterium GWB2_35_6b]|nr:MAG: hypothetical protein A2068_00215 [Ignavibacteria bacterium GWB2_35_6b]
MVKKEQLFSLIKSLTKAEKRYFKLFASINSADTNYILLFDAIDSQNVYNEKAIKEKFKEKNFIKQLHVTKNYLNKLILKSLRNYHSKISVDAELKDLLREIEILYRKELFEQCSDAISKAERISKDFENQTALLEIQSWKRKLLLTKGEAFRNQNKVNKIIADEKEILENLFTHNEYWHYTINVFDYFRKGKKELNALLKNKLINDENNAKTLQSKILFYHLKYSFAIAQNKSEEALTNLTRLIKLIEKHPARITDDPHSYITALNNKIGMLLNLKNYNEIPELLFKVRNVPQKYKLKDESKITFKLLLRTYNVELEMYRDTENIKKGIELIDEVKDFVTKNNDSISPDYKSLLFYQFAYIYFMNKNYGESLKWINKIIGGVIGKGREDIESYARFLNLIIHYELNNVYVLRYAVEATRRFLKKKRDLKEFEKILLKFFSRLSTCQSEKHKELFSNLNMELFSGITADQKANILDYLNFEKWIESKK